MLRRSLIPVRTSRSTHPSARLEHVSWRRTFSSTVAVAVVAADGARKPLFDKILIANRGEIACRVVRTARQLGIRTVAIYSPADAQSLHVQMADEAHLLSNSPIPAESYLLQDRILEIAHKTGAQAIHPGYGFLSENEGFCTRVRDEGLVFIGPTVDAIRAMASKSKSKIIMTNAGVPVVPGYHGEDQSPAFLRDQAEHIGYPVLIKAVLGGGGKGMRIVLRPEDFDEMLDSARREAMKSFSDDRVLIEKYIVTPRHVEVQVFSDSHGNHVHLGTRDCSLQRRHQKVLEEAPAPNLPAAMLKAFGDKAVAAASAVNYLGAGTVEFILDNAFLTGSKSGASGDQGFYFMEMNTRLQVEHPVTEAVTGEDLVRWQLEVAAGNPVPKLQRDIATSGHAIEARIYAENPANNFMPDVGPLLHLRPPKGATLGHGDIRYETGVRQGDQVSVYYDPMIAKLIVRAEDRTAALRLMRKTLSTYEISGLGTNIDFLKKCVSHPAFVAGDVETGFIKSYYDDLFPPSKPASAPILAAAALNVVLREVQRESVLASNTRDALSPWSSGNMWRSSMHLSRTVALVDGDLGEATVQVTRRSDGAFDLVITDALGTATRLDNCTARLDAADAENKRTIVEAGTIRLSVNVVMEEAHNKLHVFDLDDGKRTFTLPPPEFLASESGSGSGYHGAVTGRVVAPMPCKVASVLVKVGDSVKQGQTLVIVEAMKMEHVIKAPADAVVERIGFAVGAMAGEGATLVKFADEAEPVKE